MTPESALNEEQKMIKLVEKVLEATKYDKLEKVLSIYKPLVESNSEKLTLDIGKYGTYLDAEVPGAVYTLSYIPLSLPRDDGPVTFVNALSFEMSFGGYEIIHPIFTVYIDYPKKGEYFIVEGKKEVTK